MLSLLLSGAILFYFIRGQFRYEKVARFRYWILPVYAVIMFTISYQDSTFHRWLASGMLIIGLIIGWYQAHFATLRTTEMDQQSVVEVRGGWAYLSGWVIILIIQLVITAVLEHHGISLIEAGKETISAATEELFPWRRFGSNQWWPFWELSGVASVMYTEMLAWRYPAIRKQIQGRRHQRHNHQSK